ncbi:MAG: hypothetical protein K5746_11135 [Clostridiales bacterium]|nr:hypothetical protein [Clostridiales bacterium]
MKNWLILLLVALLVFTSAVALADTYSEDGSTLYYDTPYVGKTAEADVVLRGSAYSRGSIVDTLRKGVKLTVTASKYASDGTLWYQAETTSRKTGWVPADQVVFEDTESRSSGSFLDGLLGGRGYGSYIGNINTHVYHLPICRVLPKEENRVYFDSAVQAVGEGYRPCGICKP